ncbi:hypothetical protein M422DRAFT_257665 [Sphaerobolus stellatus SS14]|uniref:Uncharacterized protein n=1 Tax=Sphaerobolus stellatus (strain SS14) TaxID=990650 RepID=A0A0C9UXH6_SPHS4|nr:hypothetical protein M422DRAFT_257665 [Sphaerobolus stellatus SS14]
MSFTKLLKKRGSIDDITAIKSIIFPPSKPTSIAPLKNKYLFQSLSIPSYNYHCLDWWHNHDITVQLPAAPLTSESESTISTAPPTVSTTFSLWGMWAVESNPLNPTTSQPMNRPMENKKLWFSSNIGFRSVCNGEDEDELPVCPVFKEIGMKYRVFNLALIPIQVDT